MALDNQATIYPLWFLWHLVDGKRSGTTYMLTEVIMLVSVVCLCFHAWALRKIQGVQKSAQLSNPLSDVQSNSSVTVVIAARNEEACVVQSLNSILNQQAVERIIFVDDHSADHTLDLAKNVSAHNKCICVYSAPPVPEGWTGKAHALHYGAKDITTTYILFTDADVILAAGTVQAAVHIMDHEQLDHLSGNFYIHCATAAESICAPVLAASSAIALFGAADRHGAATGAFNLVRADFYHHIGGHRAIKGTVVDDVSLARFVKSRHGQSSFLGFSDRAGVRLFQGVGGFFRLISRSAQSYLGDHLILPLLGGLAVGGIGVFILLLPWLILFTYRLGWIFSYQQAIALAAFGASYGMGLAACRGVTHLHNGRPFYTIFYPFPLSLLGLATLKSSMIKILNLKINWRGRSYKTV